MMLTLAEVITASNSLSSRIVGYSIDLGMIVVVAGMVLCVARLLRGPHLADRALAADTLMTHLMVLVILFMMSADSVLLFDSVLVLALLGFVTSVAFAQYIMRPHLRRLKEDQRRGFEARPEVH